MKSRRTIVYIDGYNLYHSIDDLKDDSLKWLDLRKLAESMLRDDEHLHQVIYFTAFATHYPGAYKRHRAYVAALKEERVKVVLGQFKKKFPKCNVCQARYQTHEEKETDVNIAIHLIRDTLQDTFDRAIIVSADTDMRSAVQMARNLSGTKLIDVVAPPGRKKYARQLEPLFELTRGRIKSCRLKDKYQSGGDTVTSVPAKYQEPKPSGNI